MKKEQFVQMQSEGKSVEQIVAAIQTLDLDPIKVKLMHSESGEGWSRKYAERNLRSNQGPDYRRTYDPRITG